MTSDDLLHQVMEDERGQQCMVGLSWIELPTADAMLSLMARAERTTRATAQNEVSSRSHAILQIAVCEPAAQAWQDGVERCKLSLVDLAGSEWAAKAQSDDQNNRLDGAEINKSLLCLKECIRALGAGHDHVPFRGSKLTQVLKDSFVGKVSRTVMIANLSPASGSCEHSINTLRYASRVKEWQASTEPPAPPAPPPAPPARRPPPAASWNAGSAPGSAIVDAPGDVEMPRAEPSAQHGASRAELEPPNTAPPLGSRQPSRGSTRPASRAESRQPSQPPSQPPSQRSSQPSSRTASQPPSSFGSRQPSPTTHAPFANVLANVLVVDDGGRETDAERNDAEAIESYRDQEADLYKSLRWSSEQLEAEKAAKLVLAAEESLLATHASCLAGAPAAVTAEQRLVEAAEGEGESEGMEVYLEGLRRAMERRREELAALEGALALYEQRCAHEEEVRRQIKRPVNLPWS
jgi:kinesin family protein 2/24